MSLDFGSWLAGSPSVVLAAVPMRAAIAWARISDKPTDVVFMTATGVKLAPQTVRIEYDDPAMEADSEAGQGAMRKLTIFGIHGHADLDDTVIAKGYRFNFEGKQYTVIDAIRTHGQIQARAEAVS